VKDFLLQKKQFPLHCTIGVSSVNHASGTPLSFIPNARFNFRKAR
jgi:hypothetical protein